MERLDRRGSLSYPSSHQDWRGDDHPDSIPRHKFALQLLARSVISFEYALLDGLTTNDYMKMMASGWRRFGRTAFRPRCQSCMECRSIRIDAARFRPDRSQRRALQANEDGVRLRISRPSFDPDRFALYLRYHEHQTESKDWPSHREEGATSYVETFIDNPFPTEEWAYFIGDELLGVGFVDALPGGLSGIYFYYDPDRRERSPGTFNVLTLIAEAQRRGLPHVYLGYFVDGCRSMRYKARFEPNEALDVAGGWREFRPGPR